MVATARCRCTSRSCSRCRSTQEALRQGHREGASESGRDERGRGARDGPHTRSRAWKPRPSASGGRSKLDSASTFECIVEGPRHFFMEVNTRIQVEHRVSELCYAPALRRTRPTPADDFDVHLARRGHGAPSRKHRGALPKPTPHPARRARRWKPASTRPTGSLAPHAAA